MGKIAFDFTDDFTALVRKQAFKVEDISKLPERSLVKVFEYGLQRILNDASANAKDEKEAVELAAKRWNNLKEGVIRASGGGAKADPVRKRAIEIAEAKVKAHPSFIQWLKDNGLKQADKDAQAELREQARKHSESFLEIARTQVEAERGLEVEIEL